MKPDKKKPTKIKLEFTVNEDDPNKDAIFAKFRELLDVLGQSK